MTADKAFSAVTRDLRLINFAVKAVRAVRFTGAVIGIAAVVLTAADAVRLIKK